jgi:hypothetical protein
MPSKRQTKQPSAVRARAWQPGSASGYRDELIERALRARPDEAMRRFAIDLQFGGEKVETASELLDGLPMSFELAQVGRGLQVLAGGRGATPHLLDVPLSVLLENAVALHARGQALIRQLQVIAKGHADALQFCREGLDLAKEGLRETGDAICAYRDRFLRILGLGGCPQELEPIRH